MAVSANQSPFLLVEDNADDVLLIQRAFRRANIPVTLQVASDGDIAEAYLTGTEEFADRGKYPLPYAVLLDLKLPRKSGLEVLAWIRREANLKRLPVVVLTSSRESSDIDRAYDLGANSYLVKPVGFNDLLDLIKTLNLYWVHLNEPPTLNEA